MNERTSFRIIARKFVVKRKVEADEALSVPPELSSPVVVGVSHDLNTSETSDPRASKW
jgi:hypothetical protein